MSQELKERITPLQEQEQPVQQVQPQTPPPAKSRNGLAGLAVFLSAMALVISCAALYITLKPQAPQQPEEQPPEQIQPMAVEAVPTVSYRDRELPVWENVPLNQYDVNCIRVDDQGWLRYEDGQKQGKIGIDVSAYQGDIDWKKVAQSGVEFAMIRCGYRGYSKGVIVEDKNFTRNIKGALNAGLEVGVYFFSQATNVWEAQEEADYVLQAISGYDVTYPVAFDWEFIT